MEKVAVCLHLRTEEDFEHVLCPEQVLCPELCHEGETNGLSAPHSARAVSRERRLPAAPARTPPRASLDPPNGALTDKHLANLMLDTEKVCMQLCARLRMCVRYAQVQSKQEPVRYLLYTNQCVNSCSRFFSHP